MDKHSAVSMAGVFGKHLCLGTLAKYLPVIAIPFPQTVPGHHSPLGYQVMVTGSTHTSHVCLSDVNEL